MWSPKLLTHLGRRLSDDDVQRRILIAATALMLAETARRIISPEKEKTVTDSDADTVSSRLSSDHTGVPRPSFFPHATSLVSRVECAGLLPNRLTRLRRHQTITKMNDTATKENLETKYKVQWRKPLGEGTFGSVYPAIDRITGEHVAVKKIPKELTDNVSFQREMDALLHLRDNGGHPNICGLRENFEEGEHFYLVLDLISGGEMFDRLCEKGAYSEADAARLLREVASALAFLHGIGIVHGDMKPENIMLSSENSSAVVKLVDFGCAQVVFEDGPLAGKVVRRGTSNTPAYSPPEILGKNNKKEERLDASFDMWALGVILYIMLTGVHPFDLHGNASEAEIEYHIQSKQKPPLRKSPITAHLSADAIEVIGKLIKWDPTQRLTAFELLNNPWVLGETAREKVMADSDKRLSAYRAFNTKLEAKVFADMVSWSGSEDVKKNDVAKRTSLIEHAFQNLDPESRGYVTTSDLRKLSKDTAYPDGNEDDNSQLSLSGFSDLLAENMKNRYFPKGHIVYNEGDIGNVMYFINSGSIQVYTRDGFNKIMRKPGDFFGEGALMHPKKIRSASIRCVTPVHAIEISREYFEKYLATEEGTMLNLREKDRYRKRQRAKTILGLQKNMIEKNLQRGDFVFERGDEGNDIYILEEGKVDISVGDHTVLSLQPGEMCGEHSLIMGRPRNVSAKCVSKECRLQGLRARDFYELLDSHPTMKATIRDMCLRREFQKALCVKTKKSFPRTEAELRAAFKSVDTDKDDLIVLPDVRSMILNFDPTYSEEDVKDILLSLDLNESGTVSWEEFKRIFFGINGGKKQSKKEHAEA
jgi:serine/threonine protein kinase